MIHYYPGGTSTSLPVAEPEILEESRIRTQRLQCIAVHDGPVNTMSYVTWVFHSYFGLSLPMAEVRTTQVHTTGRAVTSQGARERAEVDVTTMHGYGLRATIEPIGDDAGADDSSGGC